MYPIFPLGDRVSIAALKIYTPTELAKPETAEAYLTVVRAAFSHADLVRQASDKDSAVTLFVLEHLKEKELSAPSIERRIDYIRGCVKNFTCSSQREYAFFHKSDRQR
jgi:hypothetical protein